MILDKIIGHKKNEVAKRKKEVDEQKLTEFAMGQPPARDFTGAITAKNGIPSVIAEVKKASPSRGIIREDFDPVTIAKHYEAAGASAISVLTDEEFFKGHLDYLKDVKKSVGIPVLRKDFIIDKFQIAEAKSAGADAVLLIVAALSTEDLQGLMCQASLYGLHVLCEAHDEEEAKIAVDVGAELIGINNRDLRTFETDIKTTERVLPHISGAKVVSESGIFTREDMVYLGSIGVSGVLIGEALMREDDIEAKLRGLL